MRAGSGNKKAKRIVKAGCWKRMRFLMPSYPLSNFAIQKYYENEPIFNPTGTRDITSTWRRPNFEKFPRRFHVLFDVISMVQKFTLFSHTFFDVISFVEISMVFLLTFFDLILMVE